VIVLWLVIGFAFGLLVAVSVRVLRRERSTSRPEPEATRIVPPRAEVATPAPLLSEQVQAALDGLGVGVVYADETGRVVIRNRAAEHSVGAKHGDVLVDEAVENALRAAARGTESHAAVELFGPPSRVLDIDARPVEGGGAIATILDITERTRVDAVRTDFVANISHELKTPVGALSVLAETLADADEPEVVTRLSGKVVKEAERLARTIDDLLELSRIELGGKAVRDPVRADAIIEDAVDRVSGLADRRQIRIVHVKGEDELVVLGDRRQLVSALGNLIDNAVKYSDPGSEVRVQALRAGDRVGLAVSDRGIGIGSQHLERIFERFYRVDRARSRETGGTGLGLAIVRHVAVNHGGEVTVTSQEGEGSTFTLLIPLDSAFVRVSAVNDVSSSAK
jgi:two-component system sensor histidine kinase SenX3